MNCDDAFDQLTSPGANDNRSLSEHLNRCPRCRAMQETLSPAIAWFSADVTPNSAPTDLDSPPALFLSEDAVQVAERAAHRLAKRRASAPPHGISRRTIGAGFAMAALAAMFCFAFILPSFRTPPGRSTSTRYSSSSTMCLWKMPADGYSRTPPTADQLVATCAACHLTSQ